MGCKCNERKEKPKNLLVAVKYIYCPQCNNVIVERLTESESIGYKCKKCKSKVAIFMRPPSPNRLSMTKERMGV